MAVVRLNEAECYVAEFEAHGIRHQHHPFDNCTPPADPVVSAFLALTNAAPGLIAVHCRAGLSRTSILITLHLMRAPGFPARVGPARPWAGCVHQGSVLGEQ